VVVLAGTVAADPVQRRMPSGDEVTELRQQAGGRQARIGPAAVPRKTAKQQETTSNVE
jgi:hypothetical protein